MCLERENMTNYNILIAGFGGQGIQFAGKLLTYEVCDFARDRRLGTYGK